MLGSLQESRNMNLTHIQQAFGELAELMENVKTASEEQAKGAVSYTHLTLPTILLV